MKALCNRQQQHRLLRLKSIPGQKAYSPTQLENLDAEDQRRKQLAQLMGESAMPTFRSAQKDDEASSSSLPGQLTNAGDGSNVDSTKNSNTYETTGGTGKNSSQPTAEQLAALQALQQQAQQKLAADQAAANAQATARQQALQQALAEAKQKQQEMTKSMQNQAKAMMASWTNSTANKQRYVAGKLETQSTTSHSTDQANANTSSTENPAQSNQQQNQGKKSGVATIKAGEVSFAILNTEINSDQPGPILATIVSGPLRGAKLVGSLDKPTVIQGTNGPESVILNFSTMSSPELPTSESISAVAIDADTARTALASDVDHHYLYRYGTVFASAFLSGYGNAITSAGTTTFNDASGGSTTISQELSPKEQFLAGLGNVGTQLGSQLNGAINRPNTIIVKSGTTLGILFLNDVII